RAAIAQTYPSKPIKLVVIGVTIPTSILVGADEVIESVRHAKLARSAGASPARVNAFTESFRGNRTLTTHPPRVTWPADRATKA
ncbi:MAG: hypothetical protein WAN75_35550, partial [Xanthobacteraceae bacterium]